MPICQVEGCRTPVSKPGHAFCLDHWRAERAGNVVKCTQCGRWHDTGPPTCSACASSPANTTADEPDTGGMLSSTRSGKHFGLSNMRVNLILAELGWIEKYIKGWVPTDRGNAIGANVR